MQLQQNINCYKSRQNSHILILNSNTLNANIHKNINNLYNVCMQHAAGNIARILIVEILSCNETMQLK